MISMCLTMYRKYKSPTASLFICVFKKDHSAGCVLDYRYVTSFKLPVAFGSPDMVSVLQRIGQAKYITMFDVISSYRTIPVKREHQ